MATSDAQARTMPPVEAAARRATAPKIGRARRERFLARLREAGNVTAAARATEVPRATWYRLRDIDPDFARAWREALDMGLDALEDEAVRRALEGNAEPVFYQGQQVGTVRKYSDALLMFLLRAHRPWRYRERVGLDVPGDVAALLRAVDGADGGLGREPADDR